MYTIKKCFFFRMADTISECDELPVPKPKKRPHKNVDDTKMKIHKRPPHHLDDSTQHGDIVVLSEITQSIPHPSSVTPSQTSQFKTDIDLRIQRLLGDMIEGQDWAAYFDPYRFCCIMNTLKTTFPNCSFSLHKEHDFTGIQCRAVQSNVMFEARLSTKHFLFANPRMNRTIICVNLEHLMSSMAIVTNPIGLCFTGTDTLLTLCMTTEISSSNLHFNLLTPEEPCTQKISDEFCYSVEIRCRSLSDLFKAAKGMEISDTVKMSLYKKTNGNTQDMYLVLSFSNHALAHETVFASSTIESDLKGTTIRIGKDVESIPNFPKLEALRKKKAVEHIFEQIYAPKLLAFFLACSKSVDTVRLEFSANGLLRLTSNIQEGDFVSLTVTPNAPIID